MVSWWECLPSGFIGAYGALLACWVPRGAKPYCGALCGRPSGVSGMLCYYGSLIVVNERCGVR